MAIFGAKSKIDAFAGDLRQLSAVKYVSNANNYLGKFVPNDNGFFLAGGSEATATYIQEIYTDEYFTKATGIKLISGRDFYLYDSGKVLVNKTVCKRLELKPENAPEQNCMIMHLLIL